jgi:aminoglycoside-2''-adenylyltransferase
VASAAEFRPSELVRLLSEADVDYVVVGGVAVVVQAHARYTDDLDICYATDRANLTRLGGVLVELGATLRGIEVDVPFVPDGRTLRGTQILCLNTPHGGLDLLAHPEGAPRYERLRSRAEVVEIAGVEVPVASIDDMIAMKRAAGRPQDLIDVDALEIARRRRRGASRS